jgi:hypothetical protein
MVHLEGNMVRRIYLYVNMNINVYEYMFIYTYVCICIYIHIHGYGPFEGEYCKSHTFVCEYEHSCVCM